MLKRAGFEKRAGLPKSQIFLNIRGDLAVHKHGKSHKFCHECCFMLESIKSKISNHYKGHHKDKVAKWLGFDEVPVRCIYSNFE